MNGATTVQIDVMNHILERDEESVGRINTNTETDLMRVDILITEEEVVIGIINNATGLIDSKSRIKANFYRSKEQTRNNAMFLNIMRYMDDPHDLAGTAIEWNTSINIARLII